MLTGVTEMNKISIEDSDYKDIIAFVSQDLLLIRLKCANMISEKSIRGLTYFNQTLSSLLMLLSILNSSCPKSKDFYKGTYMLEKKIPENIIEILALFARKDKAIDKLSLYGIVDKFSIDKACDVDTQCAKVTVIKVLYNLLVLASFYNEAYPQVEY